EQAAGENQDLDGRSDEYSLGIMLQELVTLRRAVTGTTAVEVLAHALAGRREPIVPPDARERIPRELVAIIDKATRRSRDQRYASVGELADDVRRYLRGDAIRARPDNALQRMTRWIARHREASLLAFLLVLLLSVLAIGWEVVQRKSQELAGVRQQQKIGAFLSVVARRSHQIDNRFLVLQEALEGLATAATWALTRGAPSEENVYFHEDYNAPGRAPADLTRSELYRWDVSTDYPVAYCVAGLEHEAILPTLRRLGPLRHHFQRMFIDSAPPPSRALTLDQQRGLLREGGGAMDYAYLVLPEGVLYLYPGMGCTPDDYDPRVAPFYPLAAHKHGKFWGNPYIDSSEDVTGDDLVLPCATSMYDEQGKFLGVAAVEMMFNRIISQCMALTEVPGVRAMALLDPDGHIIVDSSTLNKRFKNSDFARGLDLVPYPVPEVVAGIRAGRSGHQDAIRDREKRLIVYFRLETIGWYYLVEASAADFTGDSDTAAPPSRD
ncbi:MAG: hypothetical protein IT195_14250, partial [Microthrixaceae bacterium]|nr:hypothetical protein [Microthrixaceae bacterium]